MAIGAFPTVQTAKVALEKIQSLQLADYSPDFDTQILTPNWQVITFKNINYQYDNSANFGLKHINLTLKRGEVVFLIGANGSGKSTLAKLITGLYQPKFAENTGIFIDNQPVVSEHYPHYRQLFSAIYSDFYLFKTVMGSAQNTPNAELIDNWLDILAIKEKVSVTDNQLSATELSQGQRKRLAMLLAVAEEKSILLLDEWAADQDPAYRRVFYHHIIPMLQKMGKTLFIISHDDSYFEKADRLLMMKNGELSELTGLQREKASLDAITVIGEH